MKTDSRFSGVCIGGPYDGQKVVHSSPTLEVRTLPQMSASALVFPADVDRHSTVETKSEIYDYVPLTHVQGVWLHEGKRRQGVGLSVAAVEALVERYAGA